MSLVVGIRIRRSEPIIYADPGDPALKPHKYVVFRGEKGLALGSVVRVPTELVWPDTEDKPMPAVLRIATSSDLGTLQRSLEIEHQAFSLARSKAGALELPMKIVEARYNFDR